MKKLIQSSIIIFLFKKNSLWKYDGNNSPFLPNLRHVPHSKKGSMLTPFYRHSTMCLNFTRAWLLCMLRYAGKFGSINMRWICDFFLHKWKCHRKSFKVIKSVRMSSLCEVKSSVFNSLTTSTKFLLQTCAPQAKQIDFKSLKKSLATLFFPKATAMSIATINSSLE